MTPKLTCLAAIAAGLLCATCSGALVHRYDLNGTYADALGGPSLVPAGGTLGATQYAFGPNQGLTLSSALADPDTYTIETIFDFDVTGGYRRIIDFKNRTSDTGFYNLNGRLNFYNVITAATGDINANVPVTVALTRDAASDIVSGYVNGTPAFSFVDGSQLAVFDGPANIMHFFIDDAAVGGEASAGSVDRILIFDTALSAGDVAALYQTGGVPEPTSVALAGVALLAVGCMARRRVG